MKLKTFTSLFLFVLFLTSVKAQTTETFETESNNSSSFTDNSQVFNITSQAQGPFDIQTGYPGTGWNGTSADNRYIDNDGFALANTPVGFTISSAGSVPFYLNSMWLYLADHNANNNVSGSLTIVGKLGGTTKFTATASSGFNTAATNNGFSFINMTTFGGANNASTSIDQIVITTGNFFEYVALDAFTWTIPPSPAITTTGSLSAFSSCSGSVSTAQTFTISGTSLTTSITVTAPTGFEVSISSGSGYGGSVNLAPSSGTVSNTVIYVRLTSSATGTPSGNVACASTGATTKNVVASGTVTAIPSVSGTTPAARCDAGTVSLGATASAGTLNWYAASSGGSSLGTGISYTTPTLTTTTTYYVDATNNSCISSRSSVVATVNTTPSVSGTTPAPRCDAGTVSLGATASAGTLNWYSASSGGSSLGTGTSYTTPTLTTTTTYYVDATNNSCTSARSPVVATVNSLPVVVANASSLTLCAGETVTLTGSGATSYTWTSGVNDGVGFMPSASATYTVTGTDGNTCSNTATATIAVNSIPSVSGTTPASRCDAGTVSLGATASAGTLNWYAASSGGSSLGTGTSYTTPTLTTTTTYYVDATNNSCTSSRSSVIATVNTTPSVSGTTPASRCDAGTVSLGATASAGTLNWYAASSGGSSLGTGTSYTTPTLTTTTTYYVDATNNSCTSSRSSVVATVNTTPSISGTTSASRCGAGTLSLGATASAGTLSWYSASSGGSSLGTGTSYTTPTLTITTTYYVDATNNSCTSSRSPVVATVNNLPVVVANASSLTLCAGESVTLSGGGAASYVWTSGVNNGIGFVPTTTATYTVTGTDANTCSNTTTVTVDVNPAITNSMTVTTPICGSNNGSVSAVTQGGTSPFFYLWNNAQTSAIVTGLTGLPTQTMIITVTDSKGCTHKDTALVSCVLAVEENATEINLNISPNPSNGKFTVELNGGQLLSGLYLLELYNGFGQEVYSGTLKENGLKGTTSKETVDVNVPNGIYFLKVRSNRQSHMQKIIITR